MYEFDLNKIKIAVIGLGYVGLPLAVEFGKVKSTQGFDINSSRLEELERGEDKTCEVSREELTTAKLLSFTGDVNKLKDSNVYIITVPTPINEHKQPDLTPLINATQMVGKVLSKGDVVIYESTVYPGATEEVCVPMLEKCSGLKYNENFFCGYSPERINPGDRTHRLANIIKVTSGSTTEAANFVDSLYKLIISAGTFKASSIKVAEAAKVIENTQRDVNIALMNELSIIFELLNINTKDVLDAARTKWNFLPFWPGLVGGHCIGVDPYYLTHKAQSLGYQPEIILAGRRLNDRMGNYVASRLVKAMLKKRIHVEGSRILLMGLTFKENCPDLRNTKVVDIINELNEYGALVDCYDPCVSASEAQIEYGITPIKKPQSGEYDAVVIAVAHHQFYEMGEKQIQGLCKKTYVMFDLKSIFSESFSDLRL